MMRNILTDGNGNGIPQYQVATGATFLYKEIRHLLHKSLMNQEVFYLVLPFQVT